MNADKFSQTDVMTASDAERFPPLEEEFEQRLLAHHRSVAFEHYLGLRPVAARAGYREMHLDNRPELGQQHGYFHGGVVGAIVDTVAGHTALTVAPLEHTAVTVEYKLNFLAPASGERLIGRGAVIRKGRQLTVCRVEVFDVRDGTETLCATALVTYINVAPR